MKYLTNYDIIFIKGGFIKNKEKNKLIKRFEYFFNQICKKIYLIKYFIHYKIKKRVYYTLSNKRLKQGKKIESELRKSVCSTEIAL